VDDFGAFAVAAITLSLLEILTETGINTVLIQKKDGFESLLPTAWIVSIFRGFLIGLVLFALSPLVASYFNNPDARLLLQLGSMVSVVRGFINPAIVTLVKEYQYKKEFVLRSLTFLVDSGVAVLLAYLTKNPTSMLYGILAGAVFELLWSHIFVSPRVKFGFSTQIAKNILSKGKWMSLTGISDYLLQNGDTIFVGRVLGPISMGLYQVSYQLSVMPVSEVSSVLSKVVFPVFVKQNMVEMKKYFWRILILTTVLVLAWSLLLILFGKYIVLFVLGEKWIEAVPLVSVLGILALLRSLNLVFYAPLLAMEMQKVVARIPTITVLVMIVSMYPLVATYGVIGAAVSVILGSMVSLIYAWYYLYRVFYNTSHD
jgi:O-antigen/teichoic acid export membrane protein